MLAPLAFFQASLTVGPASISLPDLAAALTRAGMPTACSPALRDRGALVSLHGRSPEATRRVLGEALGVAFAPEGGGWRMVVDDAARVRDAKLLREYEGQAVRVAAAWAEAQTKARSGLDYDALVACAESQASGARDKRAAGAVALVRAAQPNMWIAASALRDPEFVRQVIEAGSASRTIPAASVESATGLPLGAYLEEMRREGGDLARADRLTVEAKFDPLAGILTLSSYLRADGKFATGVRDFPAANGGSVGGSRNGYQVTVSLEGAAPEATFSAMGAEAAMYLKSLAPAPALPESPRLSTAPWTLSLGLERLCAQTGQDVVMELSPRFEFTPRDVPGGVKPPLSFRTALAPKNGFGDSNLGYGYLAAEGLDSTTLQAAWDRIAARRHSWRAVDRNGAWLVVNPYGFLDRANPVSPVPFLKAERALREQGGGTIPAAPTIATARRIARTMPFVRMSALSNLLGYRDLDLRDDLALVGFVQSIDESRPTVQSAFWRDLRETRTGTIETPEGVITLRLNGVEDAPGVVGGYLFPGTDGGGADLGYVRFDGRGSVLP